MNIKKYVKENPVVAVAVIGGVGYVAYKAISGWIKKPAKKELDKIEAEKKVLEKTIDPSTGQTMQLTRSAGQWRLVADSIYNSIKYSAVSDNKANAEFQLKQPMNDLDLATLISQYGTRQLYLFGIPDGDKMTLIGAIASGELSKDALSRINSNYATKGIKFRW